MRPNNRLRTAATVAIGLLSPHVSNAQALTVHRIPAALAAEAVAEAVASCARQGYKETAVVVGVDGDLIAALRGDQAGIHSLDSARYKAYTSATFKTDTLTLEDRGRNEMAPLTQLPNILFLGGGIPLKIGDETIGAIAAAGAPNPKIDDACAKAGIAKIIDRLTK